MPAQKDCRERNSHCQLSVHSADKSWHVIAALVMLGNKSTTEKVGDQQWRVERSLAGWGTRLPLLMIPLCSTIGLSRDGCQPCSPHRQLCMASGPPALLLQHRGAKSEPSLWSCNCVSAPLGSEQDGRGTKEKSFSKTATYLRWADSEFRLWVNKCLPLQRWDETQFSTFRKLFWWNSSTVLFVLFSVSN